MDIDGGKQYYNRDVYLIVNNTFIHFIYIYLMYEVK